MRGYARNKCRSKGGRQSYRVEGIINVTVNFKNNDDKESVRHICFRAIVCKDVKN